MGVSGAGLSTQSIVKVRVFDVNERRRRLPTEFAFESESDVEYKSVLMTCASDVRLGRARSRPCPRNTLRGASSLPPSLPRSLSPARSLAHCASRAGHAHASTACVTKVRPHVTASVLSGAWIRPGTRIPDVSTAHRLYPYRA
eukprot:3940222-Rhodomonas_salina.3